MEKSDEHQLVYDADQFGFTGTLVETKDFIPQWYGLHEIPFENMPKGRD